MSPILGANFFSHNLTIDLRRRQLVDGQTKMGSVGQVVHISSPVISTINNSAQYADVLSEFTEVIKSTHHIANLNTRYIITFKHEALLIAEPARRLPPEKLKAVRAQFAHMLKAAARRATPEPVHYTLSERR